MQPRVDPQLIAKINGEIDEYLGADSKAADREKASRRIQATMAGMARQLKLSGDVKMFGSYSNGFKTGGSDLDIVFSGIVTPESTVPVLSDFAKGVSTYGYENITKIFSANVPLVKFTDKKTLMEVDFCINNDLGVRNSLLLHSYCAYDERVLKLGRVVKDWAKKHELVGTADGYLNSYAYMLLVLHYLLQLEPPVVPNLQMLATEGVPIADNKWGVPDTWETKFREDVKSLSPSENIQSVGELLIGFFWFYTHDFDWRKHAVCMRHSRPGATSDKYSLTTTTNDEQWYVEDPFDLKHNLAGKCSRAGRKRILEDMESALEKLQEGSWKATCPETPAELYFLKCRVTPQVTPQALLEEFEDLDLHKLHFPKPQENGRMGQAFLEFTTSALRRRAHAKNESYVADCQLQLHYSTQAGLAEAVNHQAFSTYEMASYKMKKQILAARVHPNIQEQPHSQGPPPGPYPYDGVHMMPPPPHGMMPPTMHPGAFPYGFPPHGMPRMPMPPPRGMMPGPPGPYPGAPGPPPYPGAPGPPPYPGMAPGHSPGEIPPFPGHPPDPQDPQAKVAAKKVAKEAIQKTSAVQAKSIEAKVKADAKAVAAAAQAKVAKQQPPTPKAKGEAKSKSNASTQIAKSGYLSLHIQDELPKNTPLLTPSQVKQLDELQVFFHQFKTDPIKPKDDPVLLQYELKNDLPPEHKVLRDHQVGKIREFQRWLGSRK